MDIVGEQEKPEELVKRRCLQFVINNHGEVSHVVRKSCNGYVACNVHSVPDRTPD